MKRRVINGGDIAAARTLPVLPAHSAVRDSGNPDVHVDGGFWSLGASFAQTHKYIDPICLRILADLVFVATHMNPLPYRLWSKLCQRPMGFETATDARRALAHCGVDTRRS